MPPILVPTKEKGATTKPTEWVYVEATQTVTDADLAAPFEGTGLNGAFVADVLSGMVTHERCGVHLYRSVGERTNNPMLKAKYREFGTETEQHVVILETLISELGGNPAYVSPMARAVEALDSKMLEATFLGSGGIDVMTAEMAMLDAVFLAETICHSNWRTLKSLSAQLPKGAARTSCEGAVAQVEEQEDEHLEWAQTTKERLVALQAKSELLATASAKGEELVARVRNWFSKSG